MERPKRTFVTQEFLSMLPKEKSRSKSKSKKIRRKKSLSPTSVSSCKKWLSNKNMNPKTGRKIKSGSTIYKKLESKCSSFSPSRYVSPPKSDICETWLKNKSINPRTKRKISPKGTQYKKLSKECGHVSPVRVSPVRVSPVRVVKFKSRSRKLSPIKEKSISMVKMTPENKKLIKHIDYFEWQLEQARENLRKVKTRKPIHMNVINDAILHAQKLKLKPTITNKDIELLQNDIKELNDEVDEYTGEKTTTVRKVFNGIGKAATAMLYIAAVIPALYVA